MYTALYRAYRPETFDTVLGQEHIVKILKNQINNDATGHAYLFCGTRGTGKTTSARLLAKGVNCLSQEGNRPCGVCENCIAIKEGTFMDVVEIDAASNNGVDNIRELNESVKYPPVVGRKKVYIIDEVHMLSTGAFNALLKTLEEPPENVIFILATTEPQKLPATIMSRCLKLDFRRVPEALLKTGMKEICKSMGIELEDGALALVAANADGSVRDGLSILDQCLTGGTNYITRDDVLEILGTVGEETFIEITDAVIRKNVPEALMLLDKVLSDGKDVRQFMRDWVAHYRNLLITKFVNKAEDMLNMSCENVERISKQAQRMDVAEINDGIIELSRTLADAKWSTQPRVLLELCIVKLATGMLVANLSKGKMESNITAKKAPEMTLGKEDSVVGSVPERVARKVVEKAEEKEMDIASEKVEKISASKIAYMCEVPENIQGNTSEDIDKEELWNSIFEVGESNSVTFNLIRTGTELIDINDRNFLVYASSENVARYVENKKNDIENIMANITGKRRELTCRVRGKEPSQESGNDIDEIKKSAEEFLGIGIELI